LSVAPKNLKNRDVS